jgi:GalNAc-alpha-(1->4)-GalNAc-alpha-(1->3)-diNAcBac-PP-undecaprenol alpha-1,4-N-acetyl-D-galactosaminyltransferase
MRIVFLTSSLGSGGAERVATTLCNAWSDRGDEVILIPTYSGGGTPFYDIARNVELVYLAEIVGVKRKNILSFSQRIIALRKLIKQKAPDVIISFLPNVNVAAILSTVLLKAPLIISERRDPGSQPCSLFWELACRLSYRFADMLTVQTASVVSSVGQFYSGLRRVRSVPNPLPVGVETQCRQDSNRRKVLLSLGRLSEEKQIDDIINVFSQAANKFTDWDLNIYGDGPLRHTLNEKIKELQLTSRIFLKGNTRRPWDVMSTSDAFILTSKFEGFPNSLLEAMGVGLPCIAYDCPSGPREITSNGVDAILVPLNDQSSLLGELIELMGNDTLRESLGAQARESILKRYQLSTVLNRWDDIFREVGVSE